MVSGCAAPLAPELRRESVISQHRGSSGRRLATDEGAAAALSPSSPSAADAGTADAGAPLPAPSRRARTPLPSRLTYDISDDVVPASAAGAGGEKLQHLLHLQDFLHNAQKLDLRDPATLTSSSEEEILARIGELRYRLDMLGALAKVLGEEMEMLQKALAGVSASQ